MTETMTVTEAVTALPAQIQCFIEREESSLQDLTVTVTVTEMVTETVTVSVAALSAQIDVSLNMKSPHFRT